MRSHIDRTVTGDTLLHSVRSLFVRLGYFPYYTSILSLGKDFKCKTSCNAVFLMCGISILADVNVLSTCSTVKHPFISHLICGVTPRDAPTQFTVVSQVECEAGVCTLPLTPALVGLNLVRIKAPETQINTIPMLQRSQRLSLQCNSVTQHITDCFQVLSRHLISTPSVTAAVRWVRHVGLKRSEEVKHKVMRSSLWSGHPGAQLLQQRFPL